MTDLKQTVYIYFNNTCIPTYIIYSRNFLEEQKPYN